uniref:Uncharacterized protein n=1 Tax=Sus scrofa TaxID=9823 RepID=A0A8D1KRF8_PIG
VHMQCKFYECHMCCDVNKCVRSSMKRDIVWGMRKVCLKKGRERQSQRDRDRHRETQRENTVMEPENLIWVETRKFGVSLQLKQIKVETLALEMKEVMEESGVYKSAAVADSIIRRTHPLTPAQQLVGWTKYILQMGDAGHLKPHTFQQPWHEQYLLGVLLFLLVVTLGTMWLCGKLLGLVARWLCGARKLKEA